MPTAPTTSQPIDFGALNMVPQGQPIPALAKQDQTTPDGFKALIVSKYPDGVASDGRKYKDIPADELTQKITAKYPEGVTKDGRKYSDFLPKPQEYNPTGITVGGKPLIGGLAAQPVADMIDFAKGGLQQAYEGAKGLMSPFTGETTTNAQDLKNAYKGGGILAGGLEMAAQVAQSGVEGVANLGKVVGGLGAAVASPILSPVTKMGTSIGNFIADSVSEPAAMQFSDFLQKNPIVEKQATQAMNIANLAFPEAANKISPLVSSAIESRPRVPLLSSPPPSERAIFNAYSRAVKPTIVGKGTLPKSAAYKNDTLGAIKTITENKPNLRFTTEDGEVQTARTPQSLTEMAQAIDQTKKSIYSQYDALTQQAGKGGEAVKTFQFTKDLQGVITNKALQLSHPEAVEYARSMLKRYNRTEPIDTKTAQSLIENYNAELQAFYRNPTYNAASKVAIDAAMVRDLRSALDEVITKSTGAQYQTLRGQYGSLKAIEGDVNKAANRVARLNNKGLADYTDIFSGGDIAAGILTLNPALFAKGVAQHGIKTWFKSLNSPDKAIKGMFQQANQLSSQASKAASATLPKTTPPATPKTINKNNPISPDTTTKKGLLQEAKKEVLVKKLMADSNEFDRVSKEQLKEYVDYPLQQIKVDDIYGLDHRGLVMDAEKPGRKVTTPILVDKNADGTYQLVNGNHRVTQTIMNGDKSIQAFVKERDRSGGGFFKNPFAKKGITLSEATQKTVDNHLTSAQQTLANLSKEKLQAMGGEMAVRAQTVNNIILSLKHEGNDLLASLLQDINLRSYPDFKTFERAVRSRLMMI